MSLELTVPEVGESITEVLIGRWLKADGEAVSKDEDLVEIETDKASVVVAAPEAGVVAILKAEGESAAIGEAIARISADESDQTAPRQVAMQADTRTSSGATDKAPAAAPAPVAPTTPEAPEAPETPEAPEAAIMPAAARLIAEHQLDPGSVSGSGAGGRLLKKDVLRHIEERDAREAARAALDTAEEVTHAVTDPSTDPSSGPGGAPLFDGHTGERVDEARPMSRIRQTIATRLVEAQQNAALLTTFNEVDMKPIIDLRARHKAAFEARHGIKLGFMPFFVHAAIEALRRFPAVNAEIRGEEIVYRNYHDIGIAIGGGRGLLVPVLRDAARMSFADIEHRIADLVARAQDNRVTPDELEGGTFTISNGGIYGSLLSTPIVNPPQSGILGMHAIQERPVVRDGEIVARPMMYLALTYDHRLIDGREAVTFLRTIGDVLEEPARLVIGV